MHQFEPEVMPGDPCCSYWEKQGRACESKPREAECRPKETPFWDDEEPDKDLMMEVGGHT